MITNEHILDALRTVVDPELGINVVDLGLIYNVESNSQSVTITMTLTTPGCPLHESMTAAIANVLKRVDPVREIHVHLVWEPSWTPERISRSAKELLGWRS